MLAPEQLGRAPAHRARGFQRGQVFLAAQVLAQGDELHLGRDDAAPRVMHLGDVGAIFRAARLARQLETQGVQAAVLQALLAIARARPRQLLGIAALLDPGAAQGRQAAADVDRGRRVGVGAGGVVDEDGRIGLAAEAGGRVALAYRAHRHADVGPAAFDIDLARIG